MYKNIGSHYFGFVDLNINEVYKFCPEFFDSYGLLVTCLDSDPKLSMWGHALSSEIEDNWDIKVCGQSVWIAAKNVKNAFEDGRVFSHFDEIYFLKSELEIVPVDEIFTTDRCEFGVNVPKRFLKAFHEIKAHRYLSDGCGLNFGCESIALAERICATEKMAKLGG